MQYCNEFNKKQMIINKCNTVMSSIKIRHKNLHARLSNIPQLFHSSITKKINEYMNHHRLSKRYQLLQLEIYMVKMALQRKPNH